MFKIYKISNMAISLVLVSTLVAPLRAENIQAITASAAQVNYYYESHFCIRTKERMFQRQIEINKTSQSNDVIEEIIEEDTPIIIEETHYVDMDVPTGKTFKSYMDARLITNKSSAQYELKSEYELDESGIYMIDGRYTCAVGSYYTTKIGTKFDVVMVSGEVIPCILADCKADEHTDNLGQYTVGNDSIVEFIVHSPTLIPNISNRWGNTGDVSTLGGIFEGEIAYIRVYSD